MIKIGLTQRMITLPEIHETRDSLDQRWINLLTELGFMPIPIPNLLKSIDYYLDELQLDGVVLTGGGDIKEYAAPRAATPERDRLEHALIEYCDSRKKPLLGVCRGMQVLVNHYGGRLERVYNHIAVRHNVKFSDSLPMDADQPCTVNSFHEFGVTKECIPANLSPVAGADDSTVEAVSDNTKRFVGIMWHPEREQSLVEWDRALILKLFRNV